jgi:hypothetical protein
MSFVARHKTRHGLFVYINAARDAETPFLGEAFTAESGVMIELETREYRDAEAPTRHFEFRQVEECVDAECERFIRDYETDTPRTTGEQAATAAMRTLVQAADGNLDVLQNSTLRTIQVLQAFQGLLSRMERRDATDTDASSTVSEQTRNR